MTAASSLGRLDRRWAVALVSFLLLLAAGGLWFAWVSRAPAMSAERTEAFLRTYTGGDPATYKCVRQGWPYDWDYACSWRQRDGGGLTTIMVNVDENTIVEQTAP